jgi:hypothetical protein
MNIPSRPHVTAGVLRTSADVLGGRSYVQPRNALTIHAFFSGSTTAKRSRIKPSSDSTKRHGDTQVRRRRHQRCEASVERGVGLDRASPCDPGSSGFP